MAGAESTNGVSATAAWLIDGARSAASSEAVLGELCDRLAAGGLPLWRVAVFVNTLHPSIMGRMFLWREGEGLKVMNASYAFAEDEAFRTSPVVMVGRTGEPIRRRLADPACPIDFPILAEIRAEGATDYLALPLRFTNGECHVATFTTRQEGGFTTGQAVDIELILAPLARVAEVRALRRVAANLLDAYVGRDAGEKILAGRIKRGDSETIRAAIWLSDMRGFTKLADSAPPEKVIERLNALFDCLAPPIEAHGGSVLKFMGDGLLAIFAARGPEGDAEARRNALAAALEARANVRAFNEKDLAEPPLRFGLALHFGEALYGNIGGGSRLDFTCIGPAINLAARMEKVASKLGRTIVASHAFASSLGPPFEPIGAFELAGFREAQQLYGLPDDG